MNKDQIDIIEEYYQMSPLGFNSQSRLLEMLDYRPDLETPKGYSAVLRYAYTYFISK